MSNKLFLSYIMNLNLRSWTKKLSENKNLLLANIFCQFSLHCLFIKFIISQKHSIYGLSDPYPLWKKL